MRTIRFLFAILIWAIPVASFGQIGIRIAIGPPVLPMYDQPVCPDDGDLWTPGYWAYDDSVSDYYWVPGTWVMAPEEGYLWTPGYWGWGEGGYAFNEGYWGPTVGFYGGINYGFGYFGEGYGGGRWNNGHFFYNSSVNNLNGGSFHNVYNARIENASDNRVSYNGGRGGIEARPNSQQEAAARERHIPAVAAQTEHIQAARANPQQRAAVNHGNPAIAASAKPGDFSEGHGVEHAKGTTEPARAATNGAVTEPHSVVHPNDLSPIARPQQVNSGNAKADKKYEQQQDKLIARQTQDRQDLQRKQDAEHQQLTRQNASDARTQQVEQRHQQQTQQLSQKHTAQQQSLQARQPQPRPAEAGPGR
jgi:WXXGXW repeat (2 copies)